MISGKNIFGFLLFLSGTIFSDSLPDAIGKIAIVVSEYHSQITSQLLKSSLNYLQENNIKDCDIDVIYVPGSYEIPYVAKNIALSQLYSAIICIGAILTKNNLQAPYIAQNVSRGIYEISMALDIPITWGILLFEDVQETLKMLDANENNNGWDAAHAAIRMIRFKKELKQKFQTL